MSAESSRRAANFTTGSQERHITKNSTQETKNGTRVCVGGLEELSDGMGDGNQCCSVLYVFSGVWAHLC
jgi:hypothetical protein